MSILTRVQNARQAPISTSLKLMIGAAGNMFATAVSMMLLNVTSILMVRLLGVEGRGMVASAILLPTAISYGTWIGLPVACAYFAKISGRDRDAVIGTARTLAVGISIIQMAIATAAILVFQDSATVRTASLVFLLFLPMNIFYSLHQLILQADLRIAVVNKIRLIGTLVYFVFVCTLYIFDIESVLLVTVAQLAGALVWTVLYWRVASSRPIFSFDRSVSRNLLGYGARAQLGSTSPLETLRLDQLILALFLSAHDLGLYVIAMTFITANRLIGISVGNIAFPVAIETAKNGARITKQLKLLLFATIGIATSISAFEIFYGRRILELFFGTDAGNAYPALRILVIASIFLNFRQVLADITRGFGYPGIPTITELLSAVTLTLSAILLWSHGLVGVAVAVLISAGVATIATLSMCIYTIRSNYRKEQRHRFVIRLRSALSVQKYFGTETVVVTMLFLGVGLLGLAIPLIGSTSVILLVATTPLVILSGIIAVKLDTRVLASIAMGAAAATAGWTGVRLATSVALSDVFLFASAILLVPTAIRYFGERFGTISFLLRGTGLIVLGGFIGSLFAANPPASIARLSRFTIAAVLMPTLFAIWKPSILDIRRISWLWVISTTISALVGVSEVNTSYGWRANGLTTHPNHLALSAVLAAGPALALTLTSGGILRIVSLFCSVSLFAGVIVSGSRAGIIAYAATLIAFVILTRRIRIALAISSIIIAAIIVLPSASNKLPAGNALSRLIGGDDATVSRGVATSNMERDQAFSEALNRAMEHPVTGEGFEDVLAGHDIYIQLWSSAGIIGLIGLAITIVSIMSIPFGVFSGKLSFQPSSVSASMLLLGFGSSFAGYVASSPFHPALWDRYIWIGPSIIACFVPMLSSRVRLVSNRGHVVLQGSRPTSVFPLGGSRNQL